MTVFVVYENLADFADLQRREVARFNTEAEAEAHANALDAQNPWSDMWHNVTEETE